MVDIAGSPLRDCPETGFWATRPADTGTADLADGYSRRVSSPDAAPLRAAIVGAGPSGFYAAEQLLKAGFEVDLFDALPTPYGLVRAGVAPVEGQLWQRNREAAVAKNDQQSHVEQPQHGQLVATKREVEALGQEDADGADHDRRHEDHPVARIGAQDQAGDNSQLSQHVGIGPVAPVAAADEAVEGGLKSIDELEVEMKAEFEGHHQAQAENRKGNSFFIE